MKAMAVIQCSTSVPKSVRGVVSPEFIPPGRMPASRPFEVMSSTLSLPIVIHAKRQGARAIACVGRSRQPQFATISLQMQEISSRRLRCKPHQYKPDASTLKA
jgi:hypothetical protein